MSADPGFDLSAPRTVHVVGVGGAGMSAIATVLAQMGHRVSGSDLVGSPVLDRLRADGVETHVGHRAEHVPAGAGAVVVSTAVPMGNPEALAARERGVPVLSRAEALRLVTSTRRTVAVSGTHGKTTTSALLALALREAGWRPSFVVGGEVEGLGGNAAYDEGEWFVVEADESDGTFVELDYEAALVTSVEPDHLEHWGGFEPLVEAFRRFAARATGPVVACADDALAPTLAPGLVTYGFAEDATYRLGGYEARPGGCAFTLSGPGGEGGGEGGELGRVEPVVPGRHNALNAAGAAVMALELGAPFDAVARALTRFAGVSRRFEFKGEVAGRTVVDDYAHLPTEVAAALATAREGPWERVVAVFQPHRYSRTATLHQDFAGAFDGADVVVLTDVYSAGEAPRPGVSGRLVLQAVLDGQGPSGPSERETQGPLNRVVYLPERADLVRHVPRLTRPGDIVLTLGAGDVTSLADEWRASLA